ncbi:MAG: hypothetical protein HY725_19525 [Candidatus Rokubacteria bacterium]|nr:hypothetical protein [Candidatus Rokubacteria bacterium]
MRRLFILFVMVHVVADLAIPSAGAFRFNPDESVVALRVQPAQAQDLSSAPPAGSLRLAVELPRLPMQVFHDPRRNTDLPDLVPLLPRRAPSSDRPSQSSTEDA